MFEFSQYLGFLLFLTILTIGFWLIFFDADPFGFELLLHGGESAEVVLAREDSEAVNHPMGGNIG